MTALPSPSRPAPKSRSRHPHDDIQSALPAMLRSSLSHNPSSASSTATTLPGYSSTPQSQTKWPTTPASVTTSRTRERLRLAELERDELRRALNGEQAKALEMGRIAEEERAIAERLKREGGGMELSPTEAKFRILQLRDDERAASAELPPRPITGLFKAVCSTDLLFLIDTTGSMSRHINAAKTQVKSIIKDIRASFLNQADVRIAVVAYKDHSDKPNIQFLDFTSSATRVRWFLGQLTACGGGDPPEDVLGGLRQALNATWMHQTRCIIHIADAPPHGRALQVPCEMTDAYPEPGSEPHGLTHQPLLKLMLRLNINYALLRINRSTDFMAFTFFEAYAAASGGCKLHKANMFYKRACVLTEDSKHSVRAGLLFEEFELGTTFNALQHLVVKMVTTSASRTAVRSSSSTSRMGKAANRKLDTNLTAIEEDEDVDGLQLELIPPKWEVPGWLNEMLNVEGFSPDVVVHGAGTLNDMMAHDDNIKMSITELSIRKRLRPFAQGTLRVASYARTTASTNQFVVKSFKRGGKRLAHLAEGMRCQALCKAFALEFNSLVGEKLSVDFIVTTCLKRKSVIPSGEECISLEPFIEGTYVKYNNNCGYVNEDSTHNEFNKAAQAFSHFTFERSQGSFLVSDLQGVGRLLTDPAIHTLDPERFKLAETNLGKEGFKFFFATHVCNDICSKLGLKSKASMVVSGRFKFRERWPSVDDIVCCSNKLCGMIVRLASAHKSDNWPGYHWCYTCWPQLFSFMSKRICVAPGPHHEFVASEFFHESQGQLTPRKCPKHRETVSMAVEIGGSNWDGLKFEKKKKSFFELRQRGGKERCCGL